MNDLTQAHVQRYYRPISLIFAVLVVVVVSGVAWTGWSSATITVTPVKQPVTTTLTVSVSPTASDDPTHLIGTITTEQQSASVTVTPQGEGDPVPAHATGTVTLHNTTTAAQPLSSGTRLKSSTDVIVRTTKRVNVPAGGTVDVGVVADPLGTDGEVAPGRLIIVALWPGLQTKIYGELETAMTGGLARAGQTLSLDELSKASDQAEQQIRETVGVSRPGNFIAIAADSVVSNPKTTVASASYTVTVNATVTRIVYQADRLQEMVVRELQKSAADTLTVIANDNPFIEISDRPASGEATLTVTGKGEASVTSSNSMFKPENFSGLSQQAIQKKLLASPAIQRVTVSFTPVWRKTAPDQPHRISLKLLPAVTATR
jgi:hypothetical protein